MESGAAGRPVSPEHGKARAAIPGRSRLVPTRRSAPGALSVSYSNKTGYSVNVERLGRAISTGAGPPGGPWPPETHPFGKRREGSDSNQAQLFSHPPAGGQGLIEVAPPVRGGELRAHPGGALRHHRVAEAGDEDALLKEHLAHPDRGRGLPDDHRDDRGLSGERLEADRKSVV